MAYSDLDQRLLSCATEPPAQALSIWEELLRAYPIEDFVYHQQRLLPAIWVNLKKASLPFAEEGRLRGTYRRAWVRNTVLHQACREALLALQRVGVPALLLKGLAYESMLYEGDRGIRPSGDFDLLVPFNQAEQALEALKQEGWSAEGTVRVPRERIENAQSFKKGLAELDLHWFVLREARFARWDEAFWEDAIPIDWNGLPVRTLSPNHQLFQLLVIADREGESSSRYLLDLFFLCQRYRNCFDLPLVAKMLKERHLLNRLRRLPLGWLGLEGLPIPLKVSRLDKAWSEASRYIFNGSHEWHYFVFPFLDYWIHYRSQSRPDLGLGKYLVKRLEVTSLQDFLVRTVKKIGRMLKQLWS